jgi:hypothetical protein
MTIEDGTHSGSRNFVGKFTLHNVQNPQNQKSVCITRWMSKILEKLLVAQLINKIQAVF